MNAELDTPIDVYRQAAGHLESLRLAGVQFVPIGERLTLAPAAPSVVAETARAPAAPPAPSDSAESRRVALALLAREVAPCNRCPELFSTRTQTVFGVGPVDPEICFIGEAPGADEDRKGEPFVGRAGQLLDKIIAGALKMKREEVYICNTIKCRPPSNRVPSPAERSNCRDYFEEQIALVRPKFIVCLGGTAAQNVLGSSLGIGKLRGQVHQFKGIPVICTYHPSAILREEPERILRNACWEDMKLLLSLMGRPAPGKA